MDTGLRLMTTDIFSYAMSFLSDRSKVMLNEVFLQKENIDVPFALNNPIDLHANISDKHRNKCRHIIFRGDKWDLSIIPSHIQKIKLETIDWRSDSFNKLIGHLTKRKQKLDLIYISANTVFLWVEDMTNISSLVTIELTSRSRLELYVPHETELKFLDYEFIIHTCAEETELESDQIEELTEPRSVVELFVNPISRYKQSTRGSYGPPVVGSTVNQIGRWNASTYVTYRPPLGKIYKITATIDHYYF